METTATSVSQPTPVKFKAIRKEIAARLGSALTDQKTLLGEERLGKHIRKISKSLAEDIVKTAQKKAKKSQVKEKKSAGKKK
jgi:hypothetical protein